MVHVPITPRQLLQQTAQLTCAEFSTIPQTELAKFATQSQKPCSSPCLAFALIPVMASANACTLQQQENAFYRRIN
jgi:hypothetical protein